MEIDAAEAWAAVLLKRAERYRGLAAKAAERDTESRLRRLAAALESEAAIEMAHAALLRNSARGGAEREEAIAGSKKKA
jgi:hypothetical protein